MKKIVLASNNVGKIKELNAILGSLFEVIPQSQMQVSEIEETGLSFVENALIKARNAAKQSNLPAIGDDSGIVVDALKGAPGIYSARYAGRHGDDESNTQKILTEMRHIKNTNRSARFWCAIALVRDANDALPIIVQRAWEGAILRKKTGTNGFGYDPIFHVASHQCSAAELTAGQKNKISHRAQALQALLEILKKVD